jgi:uncharacterized protein
MGSSAVSMAIANSPQATKTCSQSHWMCSANAGAFENCHLDPAHLPRVDRLMGKYREFVMDLADASLVIAAGELGSGRILSTDQRDFGAYRWKSGKPFKNLLI